jgi:hypothetical protein
MLKLQFQHLAWMTLASAGKRQQPPRPVQLLWSHQRVDHHRSGLPQLAMAAALSVLIQPNGSSLGSLGYDVGTSGHGNFNLIPCPTGEYVYGVHYTPYTSGGGGYQNPGRIFQYATDGSGYATFYLGESEYDYRGYQCLTIADDGSYILLSQGEKIFKIDTSTAWDGESGNQNLDRIQHTWNLPDSKGDNRYSEQLRVNSIAILPDGSRAYAAMNYNNAVASGDISNNGPTNAFAILDLQTLAQPTITQLQGTSGSNIQPNWVAAAPDSSAVYVANTRFGTNLVWRVGTNGSQTDLWKSGDAYTNAVLSGDGSRFFTTFKSSKGTYFDVYDTTNGSISKINYTYVHIDGDAQIPNSNSHGYNQPSLVVSNDGSYGAVVTTLSGVPSVGNNIHPYCVNAAPDSSGVYGANTHGGLDLVWRVPVSGPQTHLPVDDWTTTPDQHGPYTNAVLSGNGSRYFTTYNSGNGTYFKVHDTTGGTIAKIAYTYIYIDGIDTNAPPRKSTTAPGNKPHGYNQPSLVVSNDGSYGALATTKQRSCHSRLV